MQPSVFSPVFVQAFNLLFLAVVADAEPQWVWSSKQAQPNEKAIFRKTFTVAGTVRSATLTLACDNGATAAVNDRPAAETRDWKAPARQDVAKLLRPGQNELRIDGQNRGGVAAMIATLVIETADGKKQAIETGPDWLAAAPGSADWKPVTVIAKYGEGPWGAPLADAGKRTAPRGTPEKVTEPAAIQVPPGFKVELLYTVPKAEQGSWVCMTIDPKGRIIAGDQSGGLYRVTVPAPGTAGEARVEPLKTDIGGAHGLLYAFDSLYVMVNEKPGKGLWRLRDTDRDDQFDNAEFLRKCEGGGEHGPHGLALGPDGKSIYFACGNHTKLPERMEKSRAVAWGEDHLLPRLWDANGHAKGILAPGAYTCRTDPDGKTVELFVFGFRNHYDIAFDANGELFTFDSDMEWDIGTPWYMPTRINHCPSGGDCGWRSGAGRWPAYYADSLPGVLDIGPGSPTGTVFGTGAKFPEKYQRALFACDWTYGTMYAVHLVPQGASFRAEPEEFVAGKPLPLTDVLIHPQDGAMYFTIGGRKTQSALYRVSYAGEQPTTPAPRIEPTPESKLRHELEKLHVDGAGPEAVGQAWPHLGHPDRFIRFAARVAVERQPAAKWAGRALAEKNPQAAIEVLIALARVGDKSLQPQVIEALGRLEFAQQPTELRLPLLRAWQLAFTRMGKPAPEVCAKVAAKFDPLFPHPDALVNRELVQLLVFLDSPRIVPKTVPLLSTTLDDHEDIASDSLVARNERYALAVQAMHASRPNRQAIAYAYALRNATSGWTPELRKAFFAWFPRTHSWKGGNSFTKFLENIRTEALSNVAPDPAERTALDALSKKAPAAPPANFVMPKGPGKNYSVQEVVRLAEGGLKQRDFEQDKAMYSATLCASCHQFNGEGGNVGPDLTGAANRYTLRDLLENIIEPSKVISDQYGSEQIDKKDGAILIGRVVVEENGKLFVMASPLAPEEQVAVDVADVRSRSPYPISMMPPGLINSLNKEELLDLLAYIQTAGNSKDPVFKK
ncbi:MAG: c-type cytochrome [Verrucomicrobiota bacterium]|nr:c-type cytochrome [Verrucomicrobiota bacterium]